MPLKWTYLLIVGIYSVLFLLQWLNGKSSEKFLETYPEAKVYTGIRKDFFSTIAWTTLIIAIVINGLSLYGGNGLNIHAIIITLLVGGMACLTRPIKIIISEELFNIASFEFDQKRIKTYKQIEQFGKIRNSITFNEGINGYEGVEFFTQANIAKELESLIKSK